MNEHYVRLLCPFIPKYVTLNFCKYCACAKLKTRPYKKSRTEKKKKKKNKQNKRSKGKTHTQTIDDQQETTIKTNIIPSQSRVVMDIKFMPVSLNNEKYSLNITDEKSRLTTTVAMKLKSDTKTHYKQYMKWYQNQKGHYPKNVHSDGGGEFINTITKHFNDKHGIIHTYTARDSSLQNPVAERVNRTLGEGSLALLVCANLPSLFWVHSQNFMNYVKARSPHKHLQLSNPLTEWYEGGITESMIDIHELRIFGSEAWVLDPDSLKNEPKAFRCFYLGPAVSQKGSIFYRICDKKNMISRNFIINENIYPGRELFPNIYDRNLGSQPVTSENSDHDNNIDERKSTKIERQNSSLDFVYNPYFFSSSSPHLIEQPTVTHVQPNLVENNVNEHKDEIDANVMNVDEIIDFQRSIDRSTHIEDIPPLPVPDATVNNKKAWKVKAILGKSKVPNKRYNKYLVQWEGDFPNSWAPAHHLHCPELIQKYEEEKDKKKKGYVAPPSPSDGLDAKHANTDDEHEEQPAQQSSNFAASVALLLVPFVLLSGIGSKFFCYLTKLSPAKPTWKDFIIPQTYNDVLNSLQKEQWLDAVDAEMAQLIKLRTWKRCKRKPRKKPISCRWVFKIKPPTALSPEPTFKARLVAHGFKQRDDEYGATFAQVATMKAFRLLVWLTVFCKFKATQLDVKNAFLNGKIDAEIYMDPPPGFESIGPVRLKKTIYGLKQSPRIWRNTLVAELKKAGFTSLISDTCVFKHHTSTFFILVFVDDIICVTNDEKLRKIVETKLNDVFDIKILGQLKHFVGIEVNNFKDGSISLSQQQFTEKVIETFGATTKKTKTPTPNEQKFSKTQQPTTDKEKSQMKYKPYRQIIGSLLYLLATRPEIYFIIITLSAFVNNPGIVHWLAALSVVGYLKTNIHSSILFSCDQKLHLTAYCDSDWGSNTDTRKSITGYIIYLGTTPIVWRSKTQKGKPALSSCEAEYRALTEVLNDIVWIISFLTELGFDVPRPIRIYCDNKSAKDLAENPIHHDRTKHIDIRFHRIREFILDGTVEVHYVPTANNVADIFTKSTTSKIFTRLLTAIYNRREIRKFQE